MNSEERYANSAGRALIAKIADQNERRLALRRGTFLEQFLALSARSRSKLLIRLYLSDELSVLQVWDAARKFLENQPAVLLGFARDLGRRKRSILDYTDKVILLASCGFDLLRFPNQKNATTFGNLPRLTRWTDKAAWQLVAALVGKKRAPSYATYRKRVERLRTRQEKPVLVKKIKIRPSDFSVTYTADGIRWLLETGRLSSQLYRMLACAGLNEVSGHAIRAVTENGKKMSHDTETPARFNGANGSGKIAKSNSRAG